MCLIRKLVPLYNKKKKDPPTRRGSFWNADRTGCQNNMTISSDTSTTEISAIG